MATKFGRGNKIENQTKIVINNVKLYFVKEKNNNGPLLKLEQLNKRVAEATGVGVSSVTAICNQAQLALENGRKWPYESENDNKRARMSPIVKPGSVVLESIRRKIHEFYLKGELPSVEHIFQTLNGDATLSGDELPPPMFEGCSESLRKLLLWELGFRFMKVGRKKHLLERSDVIAARHAYLRQVRSLVLDKHVVFLDETYIHENHSVSYIWKPNSWAVKTPRGKGKRLIVLHAGNCDGFIPNCMLMFPAKSGVEEYHDGGKVFQNWFENKLLKNIPKNSTIILNNSRYHCVQLEKTPTESSIKTEMQAWLSSHGIPFDESLLRAELYELIKSHTPPRQRHVIDELAASKGHRVIRLPPYHSQFNPIEAIWSNVKTKVGERNTTYKLEAVEKLTAQAIDEVTESDWAKEIDNLKTIYDEYWTKDGLIEKAIERLIVTDSSSDDNSDDSDDEFRGKFED